MSPENLHTEQLALKGPIKPDAPLCHYLEKKYSLTLGQVQTALQNVGNDVKLVEGFIQKNRWSLK